MSTVSAQVSVLEFSEFLYEEAHLLDERRHDEWLELFEDDATYLMPGPEGDDPNQHVAIIADDRPTLVERVTRLRSASAFAQSPHSRTCRLIANPQVVDLTPDGLIGRANFVLTESRSEVTRIYSGRYEVVLRRQPDGRLTYRQKLIRLINNDAALGNITFLW